MHKSKIQERLAFIFQLIAVLSGLTFCSIDAEIAESAGKNPIIGYLITGVITAVFGLVGWILDDTRKAGRIFTPLSVVAGAFLFSIFNRLSSPFKQCYRIKKHCGSYRETFSQCRYVYDEISGYNNDYYDEDDSIEYEEMRY